MMMQKIIFSSLLAGAVILLLVFVFTFVLPSLAEEETKWWNEPGTVHFTGFKLTKAGEERVEELIGYSNWGLDITKTKVIERRHGGTYLIVVYAKCGASGSDYEYFYAVKDHVIVDKSPVGQRALENPLYAQRSIPKYNVWAKKHGFSKIIPRE